MITIERLSTADAERLREVRLRALREAPYAFVSTYEETAARPAESWRQQLADLATFVAVDAGRDVGLVRCGSNEQGRDSAYLISMWVAPEARGRGVGVALIDAAGEWARVAGYRRIVLDVGTDNAHALALYERAGFVACADAHPALPPREQSSEIQLELVL